MRQSSNVCEGPGLLLQRDGSSFPLIFPSLSLPLPSPFPLLSPPSLFRCLLDKFRQRGLEDTSGSLCPFSLGSREEPTKTFCQKEPCLQDSAFERQGQYRRVVTVYIAEARVYLEVHLLLMCPPPP